MEKKISFHTLASMHFNSYLYAYQNTTPPSQLSLKEKRKKKEGLLLCNNTSML